MMKYPKWQDIQNHWNDISVEARLRHVSESLKCKETNQTAQFVATQKWESIPYTLAEIIAGESQIENDVFNNIQYKCAQCRCPAGCACCSPEHCGCQVNDIETDDEIS